MTLPLASMPAAISSSVAAVLNVHGLSLSPGLLREVGNNCTQALFDLDEQHDDIASPTPSGAVNEERDAAKVPPPGPVASRSVCTPSSADLFAVGQTLRALAAAGRPNAETAEVLARVGNWLADVAKAETTNGSRAA